MRNFHQFLLDSHSPKSQMKRSSKRNTAVRQYNKSDLPRLRWTPTLHDHFIDAVEHLGGKHNATPKRILQLMSVDGLRISHVKSHLQMYRSNKDPNSVNILAPLMDQTSHRRREDIDEDLGIKCFPHRTQEEGTSGQQRQTFENENLSRRRKGFLQQREQLDYGELESAHGSEEDTNGEQSENCELSLSFNSTIVVPFGEEKESSWPPTIDQILQLSSAGSRSNESNHINLELTI